MKTLSIDLIHNDELVKVNLYDIDPTLITHDFIKSRLRQIYRNNSQSNWSVWEHCKTVYHFILADQAGIPSLQARVGLYHDAAEAFIGDIASPIKKAIPEIRDLEWAIQVQCYRALLPLSSESEIAALHKSIKPYDLKAYALELKGKAW
jgi:5'-deoxynucleotidase YfbR-like HD superfamily hydrolase